MQTLAAVIHRDYNEIGTTSYEYVVQVMNQLGLPQNEKEQFFKRMVFNVMARNQDDHIKNISFLMDKKGKWSLSPAYDMTYAFDANGKWTSTHQMFINGKRQDILLEDLIASSETMGIKKKIAMSIIFEVTKALSRWEEYAEKAELNTKVTANIKKNFILYVLES